MGVENVCTKLPKGTPLRQIWSNKSFGVCGSDVVLTLYGGEKKYARIAIGNSMSSVTLLRYRDVVMTVRCSIATLCEALKIQDQNAVIKI